MVLGTKAITRRLAQIDSVLRNSFGNVRRDMERIYQWLDYLYHQNQAQEDENARLQKELADVQLELKYVPKGREEIRKAVDGYYSFEPVLARIQQLNEKVEELAGKHEPLAAHVEKVSEKVEKFGAKKESLKEKIVKKISRNSKQYVKNLILSLIQKYERIPGLQLREIVVDEQGLCSKSSLYRLLGELEQEEQVDVVQEGKEKLYVFRAVSYTRKRGS